MEGIHHKSQSGKEKEKESLRQISGIPSRSRGNRDVLDEGRGLEPRRRSDGWRTKEISSRRKLRWDINKTWSIHRRCRGKETAIGHKPQRWSLRLQGSSITNESRRRSTPHERPTKNGAKGCQQQTTSVLRHQSSSKGPHTQGGFHPGSIQGTKTAIELVYQIKWPRDVIKLSRDPSTSRVHGGGFVGKAECHTHSGTVTNSKGIWTV